MEEGEYKTLPRMRRLAIFLLVIGPEQAAPIIKALEPSQRGALVREISEIEIIDESMQQEALREFSIYLTESMTALRGGEDAALAFLENSLGVEEAEQIASEIGPPKIVQQIRDQFAGMKASQVWTALSEEDPQVMAYVLSAIDAKKSAEILSLMEEDQSKDVFVRMSQLGPTASNLLPRVVQCLISAVPKEVVQTRLGLGGASHSAEVLKRFDPERTKALLSAVDSIDEKLGNSISKEMFSFKDLVDLSMEAMQRIMREIDSAHLVVAMRSASPELLDKIYSSLSKRGAEALKEEFEMQGSVRLAEVEMAQDSILGIVRKLQADGEIQLGSEEEEFV